MDWFESNFKLLLRSRDLFCLEVWLSNDFLCFVASFGSTFAFLLACFEDGSDSMPLWIAYFLLTDFTDLLRMVPDSERVPVEFWRRPIVLFLLLLTSYFGCYGGGGYDSFNYDSCCISWSCSPIKPKSLLNSSFYSVSWFRSDSCFQSLLFFSFNLFSITYTALRDSSSRACAFSSLISKSRIVNLRCLTSICDSTNSFYEPFISFSCFCVLFSQALTMF